MQVLEEPVVISQGDLFEVQPSQLNESHNAGIGEWRYLILGRICTGEAGEHINDWSMESTKK